MSDPTTGIWMVYVLTAGCGMLERCELEPYAYFENEKECAALARLYNRTVALPQEMAVCQHGPVTDDTIKALYPKGFDNKPIKRRPLPTFDERDRP